MYDWLIVYLPQICVANLKGSPTIHEYHTAYITLYIYHLDANQAMCVPCTALSC